MAEPTKRVRRQVKAGAAEAPVTVSTEPLKDNPMKEVVVESVGAAGEAAKVEAAAEERVPVINSNPAPGKAKKVSQTPNGATAYDF